MRRRAPAVKASSEKPKPPPAPRRHPDAEYWRGVWDKIERDLKERLTAALDREIARRTPTIVLEFRTEADARQWFADNTSRRAIEELEDGRVLRIAVLVDGCAIEELHVDTHEART